MSQRNNPTFLLTTFLTLTVITALTLPGQAAERVLPIRPVTHGRARIGAAFLPRPAESKAMTNVKVNLAPTIYIMTHTVFEAEDWGDMPDLGLSVQDMSPFGSGWSGNKQIFWNPGYPWSFQWDFAVPGARTVTLDLTAAPDYGVMWIKLDCFQKQPSSDWYHVVATQETKYDGYAPKVMRRSISLHLAVSCSGADAYRLTFKLNQPFAKRRFAGIDRIVITK